jgi:Bacterial Ig-like domain/PA domain
LGAALVAALALLLFAPGARADHSAGGGLGGSLLPDLKTKEPERFSISQSGRLYLIDPSAAGFASVGGSHQTWSRSPNRVTGDLVYDVTSLGTKRGCADAGGTSPWTGTPHAGKIVLMDRGDCAVSLKVHNAAAAGAVAAVIANNVLQAAGESPPNFTSGGGSRADDIAAYTITLRDGNKLKGLPETTAANTNPSSPNALNAPATIDPSIFTGEVRLLLDNEVGNTHTGPLELWAAGADSDCDGNGSVEAGERIAYQRHYQDGSSNDGRFVRGQDTSFTDVQVGCFAYHPAHGHTHFGSFATYELRRLLDNALVSSSEKVTFCIADIFRVAGSLPGAPTSAYYTDCGALSQGLSVGWSDEYPYSVAGQHIVLNPNGIYVGDGSYCVVSVADPTSILYEENNAGTAEANNAASVQITLSGNGSSVQTFPGTSCGGVGPESWSNPPSPPPQDTTPPTIGSVSPAAGATGVSASSNVTVAFSEAMNTASAQGAFSLVKSGSAEPVTGAFSWSGNTMTFDPSAALEAAATYTARVTTAAEDTAGNALGAEKVWSFTVAAASAVVTAYPSGATIDSGSIRSGTAAQLWANDDSYYEVNSTTSGTRRTSWYGAFSGVSNALTSLKITYSGKNSRSCTQTISVWRWTTSTWVQLDSRSVGTTEVLVADRTPSGALADYVSGTSGDGELRVRVRCTRSFSSLSFYTSGDLLQVVFQRP